MKSVQIRSCFWSVFFTFELNTERYFSLNAGKYGPEITPYLDTFHAVTAPLLNIRIEIDFKIHLRILKTYSMQIKKKLKKTSDFALGSFLLILNRYQRTECRGIFSHYFRQKLHHRYLIGAIMRLQNHITNGNERITI